MRIVTVASASYIHKHGAPETPAELAGHNAIIYLFQGKPRAWNFMGPAGSLKIEPRAALRTNDAEHVRGAVLAGIGISHNPGWLYAQELASGLVVSVLADYAPDPFPIYAVCAAGRRIPSRVQVFIDFLAALCTQEAELRSR